jgi:hypothetical protein
MAKYRSEQLAIGGENKLVLRVFPDGGHNLTLEEDQVILMTIGIAAVPSG